MDDAGDNHRLCGSTMRSADRHGNGAGKGVRCGIFAPSPSGPSRKGTDRGAGRRSKKIVVAEHNCGQIVLEVEG